MTIYIELIIMENITEVTLQNKFAIFLSGTGSNAMSLINFAKRNNIYISCIICDQEDAAFLRHKCTIETLIIPYHGNKQDHEEKILNELLKRDINWIFLAGYMRILSSYFIDKFQKRLNEAKRSTSRIINIHPSLLPRYKGLNAYQRFFKSNDQFTGISIHYVDSGIDTGEVIVQEKIERIENENYENFVDRAKKVENQLYPIILNQVNKLST